MMSKGLPDGTWTCWIWVQEARCPRSAQSESKTESEEMHWYDDDGANDEDGCSDDVDDWSDLEEENKLWVDKKLWGGNGQGCWQVEPDGGHHDVDDDGLGDPHHDVDYNDDDGDQWVSWKSPWKNGWRNAVVRLNSSLLWWTWAQIRRLKWSATEFIMGFNYQ